MSSLQDFCLSLHTNLSLIKVKPFYWLAKSNNGQKGQKSKVEKGGFTRETEEGAISRRINWLEAQAHLFIIHCRPLRWASGVWRRIKQSPFSLFSAITCTRLALSAVSHGRKGPMGPCSSLLNTGYKQKQGKGESLPLVGYPWWAHQAPVDNSKPMTINSVGHKIKQKDTWKREEGRVTVVGGKSN